MASGERYDPALNQWEMISSMNRQRSDASAASLRGKVYIAGGFTGTEVLISVETYDPAVYIQLEIMNLLALILFD